MKRVFGILVAFLGCSVMVLGGIIAGGYNAEYDENDGGEKDNSVFLNLMGQVSFFLNCSGASLYVIASKKVLATARYEPVAVVAWSTAASTFMMGIFALMMSLSETMSSFFCSDCEDGVWYIPSSAIPTLVWYVFMTSCGSFGLMTWANKYASGTLVIGFSVLQPLASAILIVALITLGVERNCDEVENGRYLLSGTRLMGENMEQCLVEPDRYTAIGALGVMTGM